MSKKHTPEQTIRKLREAESELACGATIAHVCQELGVSEPTFHRWRNQYGGMKADGAKRVRELEAENARLKKLVADLSLDKQMLQGGGRKKVLTADHRRRAVRHLMSTFAVSQRRACAVGQPRATQRQQPRPREDEARLVARMLELVRLHPRFGYRRVRALLVAGGWRASRKRVHRLWRADGLRGPKKARKKRRLGSRENGCVRRRSRGKDDVRCWDVIHDRTARGGPLK